MSSLVSTLNVSTLSSLESLLDEIFLTPSNVAVANRFSPENQASVADCSGKCNGICHPRG